MMYVSETLSDRIRTCRAGILHNPYQGSYFRALFVCSMGLLRSPTCAHVAAGEFGWNSRCAGTYEGEATQDVTPRLMKWADVVFVMTPDQVGLLEGYIADREGWKDIDTPIVCLNIPDQFPYRDPELVRIIRDRLTEFQDNNRGFWEKKEPKDLNISEEVYNAITV